MKSIDERVKSAREKREMSQADLAKAAGVSAGTIGNLESGVRKQPRGLLQIAEALGVHALWLQTGKGPRELGSQFQSQMQAASQRQVQSTAPSAQADLIHRALQEVAACLQRMSPVQRAAATGALHHLLEDPSSWQEVADQITRITDTGNEAAA